MPRIWNPVDEVLAVGDAEFQEKCLGKMYTVARSGRTVLFVSHNMTAVERLCDSCILFQSGSILTRGYPAAVLNEYLGGRQTVKGDLDLSALTDREGAGQLRFARISFMDGQGKVVDRPRAGQSLQINLRFSGDDPTRKSAQVGVVFATARGVTLFMCDSASAHKDSIKLGCDDIVRVKIPELPLSAGTYRLRLYLERSGIIEDWIKDDIEVEVGQGDFFGSGQNTPSSWEGQVVLVRNYWDVAAPN